MNRKEKIPHAKGQGAYDTPTPGRHHRLPIEDLIGRDMSDIVQTEITHTLSRCEAEFNYLSLAY